MALLPECVELLVLGCQISLAVRSVGRPPPATDKAELGAVAAGAKCRPLSLGKLERGMACWGRLLGGGRAGDGEEEKGIPGEATFLSLPHSRNNQGDAL